MEFTKKEINHLTIAIVVLGVIFSFNEWGIESFDFLMGITNLLRAIILSAIILLTQIYGEKIYGKRIGTKIFYSLWIIKEKVYLGVIVPILVALFSSGALPFPMVGGFSTQETPSKRIGRKYSRLTEFEESRIAFVGIITNLLFIIIFKILTLTNISFFMKGMEIATVMVIINIIPLPPLNGSKIFFGSRSFYVLSLIFVIASIIFLYMFSILVSLIIAAIIALIFATFYYYHKEYAQ